MKFELVEFYPVTEKNCKGLSKAAVGTIHIYAYAEDVEIDLRGIRVMKTNKGFHYLFPLGKGFDHETGEPIKYPIFRFTNDKIHKSFLDFLFKKVAPEIRKRIKKS